MVLSLGIEKKVNVFCRAFCLVFFDFVSSGKSERNIDVVLLLGQFRPDSSTATGPREQRLAHVMDALLFEVKISEFSSFDEFQLSPN